MRLCLLKILHLAQIAGLTPILHFGICCVLRELLYFTGKESQVAGLTPVALRNASTLILASLLNRTRVSYPQPIAFV